MGKLGLATKKCFAPEKQLNKQKIYARLSWFDRDRCSPAVFLSTSLPGTIFSLINSCTGWTIKADHSAAPKMLAWDLSSWKLPLISQEGAQISLNNQALMIPKRLMKSVKEKEDKWGEKKKQTKPLPVHGGVFRGLCMRRQKPLTHSAQLDAIDSRTFAADFSQRESLSLKCALSPLNSEQQNKLAEESLQLLKV